MDRRDDRLERLYSEAELKALARVLGIPEPSDELAGRMKHAALIYEFMAGFDDLRATRAQRRAAFKRIEGAARELKEALDALAKMIIGETPKLSISERSILQRLAKEAGEVAALVPSTGADPETAREMFVRELVQIFRDFTGREPGRSATYIDGSYAGEGGAFYNFVVSALQRLNPDALTGLKDVIQKVLQYASPKS